MTYVLENIPAGYRINKAGATGGALLNTPSVSSSNTADYEVKWGIGATGSVTPGLEKPVKDTNGNTNWEPVPVSPAPSVVIKSVFGVRIPQINNTSGIDLPLCGGAQTLTLSVPQFYYDDAQRYPTEAYVWEVPAPLTVVNGTPATDFGPGRWLSGRTITVSVPAGQLNAVVRVVLWSKDCNQNPAFGNPPASLISQPQSVVIRRINPAVTGIAASRTALTCGDQTPVTLTATTSQPGATSFTWTLPQGWTFAPGSSQNTATVSVIPTGGAPANGSTIFEVSVTAFYGCASFTTPPVAPLTITYSEQVPTPVFTQFGDLCLGGTRRFAVAPVPGATSYTWQLPSYFPNPTVTTTVPYLDVTAPATIGSAYASLTVTAGSGNCKAGTATQPFNAGGLLVRITTPYGLPTEICPNTEVTYQVDFVARPQTGTYYAPTYTWTVDGRVVASGPQETAVTVLSPPAGQWMSIRVDVQDNCTRPAFDAVGLQSVSRLSNGQDCVDFGGFRAAGPEAAYPNPADHLLTVPLTATQARQRGEVRLYNRQGKLVQHVPATGRTAVLDMRALPEGLYQLVTPGDKQPQRQTIQVKH